jgi:hypothetical protein
MIQQLTTIEEFRRAINGGLPIVITRSTGRAHFHANPRVCLPHVIEDNFREKVIINGGRHGHYFVVGSLQEAEQRWPSLTKCY